MAAMVRNSRPEQEIIAQLCPPHPGPLSLDIQSVARVTEVIRTANLIPPLTELVQGSIIVSLFLSIMPMQLLAGSDVTATADARCPT
jgi:hypothetical protein